MPADLQPFNSAQAELVKHGFKVIGQDLERPWGGFFYIDESQIEQFIQLYFDGQGIQLKPGLKMSPKFLIVAPGKRLSWQYHDRRGEHWSVVTGPVGVVISADDTEQAVQTLAVEQKISLEPGTRHRLLGLEGWGVVAEIWEHTDATNPSNESDIVRVQDDFGR